MKLVKLEAYGFKSFADKLEINFCDGITAVVGPNGCGKSNVSDVIRWLLGEQSAKQLRGKSMQDLIFGGTEKRKSMSYCEASLYFDNTERLFPLEFDEVVISRKMYRSGESEYFINRRPTRLKEILDLFRDVGLGKEGYCVVGQGRMDAILNAKPEDRRAIFEEALGISNFRARKAETERKLQRTTMNMDRVNDIMSVLSKRIGPLKEQSENAKQYLSLRDELRYHELNSYIYSYDNANETREKYKLKIDGYSEEIAFKEQQFNDATNDYENLRQKITDTENEINELTQKSTEIKVQLERRSGEKNVLFEKLHFFEKTERALINEGEQLKKEKADNTTKKEECDNNEKRLRSEYQKKRIETDNRINEGNAISNKLSEIREKIEKQNSENFDLLDKVSLYKQKIAEKLTEQQSYRNRIIEIEKEKAYNEEKLSSLNNDEKQLVLSYNEACQKCDETEKIYNELLSDLSQCEKEYSKSSTKLNEINTELLRLKTNLGMLKGIAERYEGFSQTVKLLMKDAAVNNRLNDKIQGVVANIISVPYRYELAIETALGGAMQNIITETENDAAEIIEYLKEKRYGRLTFLPLSSVRQHYFDNKNALSEQGALGIASEVISYDRKFYPVINNLLGTTLIADNMANAINIAKKYRYNFRIVTLSGEILSPQGSMSGGSNKNKEYNVLSTDRLIKEAQNKLAVCQKEFTETEVIYNNSKQKRLYCFTEKEKLIALLNEERIKKAALEEKLYGSNLFTDKEKSGILKLTKEKEEKEKLIEELDKELDELKICHREAQIGYDNQNKSNSEDELLYRELIANKDKKNEQISECRQKLVALSGELQNCIADKERTEAYLEKIEQNLLNNKHNLEENNIELIDIRKTIAANEDDDELSIALAVIEQKITARTSMKAGYNDDYNNLDKQRIEINNEIMKLNQLKAREQFNAEKVDADLAQMQEKILEDYELTYSAALIYKDENYNNNISKKEINRLKNAINKLGTINVGAIEEYKEVNEEYSEYEIQYNDLVKAKEDLSKIIADLTNEMVTRFNNGFHEISKNFSDIFAQLFNGGRAMMTVEKTEGKEEMDFGIEIEAQPPGKKLQNISLLSGGERALTCIAILFAILRLRPMPFCVLDEIEAPLDDANAAKVASYLKEYAKETQFVVITHKKPTMESADVLFGVTMQEKGVSKIVSVRLTEAIAHSITA